MGARLTVLIVEDDLMIADLLEETLEASGYGVCGIARTVEKAVALARRHRPDLALVDFRLADGDLGTDVGAHLSAIKRVGILYATANNTRFAMKDAIGDACLVKPYRTDELLRSLQIVAGFVETGTVMTPLPRGFHMLHALPREQRELAP